MGNKADFVGAWLIDTEAKRDACLTAANNRGQQCFNVMAAYGDTTTTPPLTEAQMLQTYTLNAAAVELILGKTGARGNEFLSAVSQYAAVVVFDGRIDRLGPRSFAWSGRFRPGVVVSIVLTLTDLDGDTETTRLTHRVTGNANSAVNVARAICLAIDSLTHYTCIPMDGRVNIEPTAPTNTVTADIVVAG